MRKLVFLLCVLLLLSGIVQNTEASVGAETLIFYEDFEDETLNSKMRINYEEAPLKQPVYEERSGDVGVDLGYSDQAHHATVTITFEESRMVSGISLTRVMKHHGGAIRKEREINLYYDQNKVAQIYSGTYEGNIRKDSYEHLDFVQEITIEFYDTDGYDELWISEIAVYGAPINTLIYENFEDDQLEEYIRIEQMGNYTVQPVVKDFGLDSIFGFGLATPHDVENSLVYTSIIIEFDRRTFVDVISFDVINLDDNGGSAGWLAVDGVSAKKFGYYPENDQLPNAVDMDIHYLVSDEVYQIQLVVVDPSEFGEIMIDNLIVTGKRVEEELPKEKEYELVYENFDDQEWHPAIHIFSDEGYHSEPDFKESEHEGDYYYGFGTNHNQDRMLNTELFIFFDEPTFITNVSFQVTEIGGDLASIPYLDTYLNGVMSEYIVFNPTQENPQTEGMHIIHYSIMNEVCDYIVVGVEINGDGSEVFIDKLTINALLPLEDINNEDYPYIIAEDDPVIPEKAPVIPDDDPVNLDDDPVNPDDTVTEDDPEPIIFSDLDQDHWAYNYVMYMAERKIISGYPNGTFRPNEPFSRAEFCTLLNLSFDIGLYEGDDIRYEDVVNDDWFYPYVMEVDTLLIPYFRDDGSEYFAPNDDTTREDVAMAIVKAIGLDVEEADLDYLGRFDDDFMISTGLLPYVALAVQHGIMEGDGVSFNPHASLNRAEAATVFAKYLQAIDEIVE